MTRIEEIREFMLTELRENDIEDTTENRLSFLRGVKAAWDEDEETDVNLAIEKTFYQMALDAEIFKLKMTLLFPSLLKESP